MLDDIKAYNPVKLRSLRQLRKIAIRRNAKAGKKLAAKRFDSSNIGTNFHQFQSNGATTSTVVQNTRIEKSTAW